jgi:hypothetical protein
MQEDAEDFLSPGLVEYVNQLQDNADAKIRDLKQVFEESKITREKKRKEYLRLAQERRLLHQNFASEEEQLKEAKY